MAAVSVIFVLVVMQLAGSFSKGQIVFLQEPKNVTVVESTDAFFACSYTGTSDVPSWKIAGIIFVTSALPPKHSYNGSGLVVSNVDLSLNMSSYACFFSEYIGRGRFRDIESNTGFLIIAANASSLSVHLKPSSSTTYIKPTFYHHTAASASIQPNPTSSMLEQSFNTSGQTLEEVQPIETEIAAPLMLKQLNLPLVIGMTVSVGMSIVIAIIFIIVVCVITQRRRASKTGGNDDYTKKGEKDISIKENVAYEVPPSRIKMTENEAYAILPNRI